MEVKCTKCNYNMAKKGIMQSGNSSYDVYKCDDCGTESMRAIGINQRYHRD